MYRANRLGAGLVCSGHTVGRVLVIGVGGAGRWIVNVGDRRLGVRHACDGGGGFDGVDGTACGVAAVAPAAYGGGDGSREAAFRW